ncbi:MAG: hypothetical protein HY318_16140 [Armatimonadetes bacterium]|nr:hypothetical protein [Armatimonadota bacterium]
MAKLELRDPVRSESHQTVRPDWIGHSCASGTYRLLFGITRACVPARSSDESVLWEPVQECEIVLDDEMFGQLKDLLDELSQWYQQEVDVVEKAANDSTTRRPTFPAD